MTTKAGSHLIPTDELFSWINSVFPSQALGPMGFIGWATLEAVLVKQKPNESVQIKQALKSMRDKHDPRYIGNVNRIFSQILEQRKSTSNTTKSQSKDPMKKDAVEKSKTQMMQQYPQNSVKEKKEKRKAAPQVGVQANEAKKLQASREEDQKRTLGAMKTSESARDTVNPISHVPKHPLQGGVGLLDSAREELPKSVLRSDQGQSLLGGLALSKEAMVFKQAGCPQLSRASSEYSVVFSGSESPPEDENNVQHRSSILQPNFELIDQMMATKRNVDGPTLGNEVTDRDIGHAPLVSGDIVTLHTGHLLPQYGLIGCWAKDDSVSMDQKIFQNTNVPFSTFICGVQGSGKSHTTACMLENALVPSPYLGRLLAPISALVFSFGEFSNGGLGFDISEAASLALPDATYQGHRVKRITVLTSPSNPAIRNCYQQIPNVTIIPFKLKAEALDIGTLLTLMAVSEKSEVPLYMARVESILRALATESVNGVFDYRLFKRKLRMENFDRTQTNMLEMRLGLLESFLDQTGDAPEPQFGQGEITIVDLSDPFVSSNTACILFKLCLERFMQSKAQGKMVVLDEAHKYMLDSPGAKVLTEYLRTLIRLQRHKGTRVIISTQEPTISTELIALCSVTIIHRFTSPTWYTALKKHISALSDNDYMQQIENLQTGEALVYAPNAVISKHEEDCSRRPKRDSKQKARSSLLAAGVKALGFSRPLVPWHNKDESVGKATGQLLKLNIRKRVTRDGGESVMAM